LSSDSLSLQDGETRGTYGAATMYIQTRSYGEPVAKLGLDNENPKYGALSVLRADGTVRVGDDPSAVSAAIDVRHFKSPQDHTPGVGCSLQPGGIAPLKAEVNDWSK